MSKINFFSIYYHFYDLLVKFGRVISYSELINITLDTNLFSFYQEKKIICFLTFISEKNIVFKAFITK